MRRTVVLVLTAALLLGCVSPALARAAWKRRIDRIVGQRSVGVAVRDSGRVLYRRSATRKRIPASNQKVLMSMAMLDRVPPDLQFQTSTAAELFEDGVVAGDLWVLGSGDPTLSSERQYTNSLPVPATRIRDLARAVRDAGVERIDGSVIGSTGYFARDWYAPGWKPEFPREQCPLPVALSINGNVNDRGQHVPDPEVRAARALSHRLEEFGIPVAGPPAAGEPPFQLETIASVPSAPIGELFEHVNVNSSNYFAEMFGKRLAVEAQGRPGTIAKGAAAIRSWASRNGTEIVAHDSSGLSYENRVSPLGLARLLGYSENQEWGEVFRETLAEADQGTLKGRLKGVRVRAKTGTLQDISALSGYVWLRRADVWAEFSIMSGGMAKSTASSIEDRVVRTLTRYAR